MSDIADSSAVGDVQASAPAPDTSTSSAPVADTGADTYTPIDMPDGQQLFDRSYVEKLREESAKYRTQLRELESRQQEPSRYQVLDDYDDDDRQVWLELASTWQNDPYKAAETMRVISERVLGSIEQGTASDEFYDDLEGAQDEAGTQTLTPDKVQEIVQAEMQRQAAAQEMESMVNEVYAEVRAAGIDPASHDGFSVLWRASNETNGDVAAAIAAHKAYEQSIVDRYVQSKAAGGVTPPPNGTPGQPKVEINSLDDSFKAAREFLANQRNVG